MKLEAEMNKLTVTDEAVEIKVEGFDRIWSLKGHVIIPRGAIVRVYPRPQGMTPPWLRAPGTYVPHVIAAGTYHGPKGTEFWNTHFNDDCIVFDLMNFKYSRVVIDTPAAKKLIAALS